MVVLTQEDILRILMEYNIYTYPNPIDKDVAIKLLRDHLTSQSMRLTLPDLIFKDNEDAFDLLSRVRNGLKTRILELTYDKLKTLYLTEDWARISLPKMLYDLILTLYLIERPEYDRDFVKHLMNMMIFFLQTQNGSLGSFYNDSNTVGINQTSEIIEFNDVFNLPNNAEYGYKGYDRRPHALIGIFMSLLIKNYFFHGFKSMTIDDYILLLNFMREIVHYLGYRTLFSPNLRSTVEMVSDTLNNRLRKDADFKYDTYLWYRTSESDYSFGRCVTPYTMLEPYDNTNPKHKLIYITSTVSEYDMSCAVMTFKTIEKS